MLPDFSTATWLLAAVAAFCVGLSKSGLGGFGIFTILIMARILPSKESTGVVLPMLIFADCFAVAAYFKHAKWSHIVPTLPPAVLGIVAGYFIMPRIPDPIFRPVLGWIVLIMVALQALSRWKPTMTEKMPHTNGFAWIMGCASGIATMLANAAGPIMTVYLLARGLPKYEFVGTAAVFFFIINLVKVPFSAGLGFINVPSLCLNLVLLPLVAAGIFAGRKVVGVLPQKAFEWTLLVFAAIAAIRLILPG